MLFEYQVVYKTMNVLPENARQFAKLKVNGIGLRGFCSAERNALHSLANLQRGMKYFIPARLPFAFSYRTFNLLLVLNIRTTFFTLQSS